jgi:hypothetical protein
VLLGFQGAFDARRTRELQGWLRRTPLLGLAMLAALVVGFGLPGTISWQVRLDLAQGAIGEPLGAALVAVALLPLVPVARLAWTGIRPPGDLVAAGTSERFTVPPRTEAGTEPRPAELDAATSAATRPRPGRMDEAALPRSSLRQGRRGSTAGVVADDASECPGRPGGADTLWAARASERRRSADRRRTRRDRAPASDRPIASAEAPTSTR